MRHLFSNFVSDGIHVANIGLLWFKDDMISYLFLSSTDKTSEVLGNAVPFLFKVT